MDGIISLLEEVREKIKFPGYFQGLLHILIGRRITKPDGTVVSAGLTWRQTAAVLKRLRWDRDAVKELGLDPEQLPPRDRERFWYAAIAQGQIDSDDARSAGEKLAVRLKKLGYHVGPAPGRTE